VRRYQDSLEIEKESAISHHVRPGLLVVVLIVGCAVDVGGGVGGRLAVMFMMLCVIKCDV
jgi:hypothetical protein